MQRRAAAVSAGLLLLLAAGAYGLVGAASQPPIEVETTADLEVNESVVLGGTNYTVTSVGPAAGGTAEFEWFNASGRYTATLANNSTTTFERDAAQTGWDDTNLTYRVLTEAGDPPTAFTLREVQTVSEPTFTRNGTTFVVVDVDDDGQDETVPRDEYLPEPRTATFAEGEALDFQGNTTTVAAVTGGQVTLEWFGPQTNTRSVSNGNNVTLGGQQYIAYFPEGEGGEPTRVVLTQDSAGYEASLDRRSYWADRMRGLWGIVVLGIIGGAGLTAMAYLPSRY